MEVREPVYDCLLDPDSKGQNYKKKSKSHKTLPSGRLTCIALLVAMGGSFNFGYQLVITNPSQEAFIQFVNESYVKRGVYYDKARLESVWGGIISLLFWGCTCGAPLISTIAEKLGRKNGLQFSHVIQIIAYSLAVASFFQKNHYIYAFSRFMLGFAYIISLGITPIFIAECSPKACRGTISMTTGIVLQIALVIGAVVAMPHFLGSTDKWWIIYAVEAVLICFVIFLMPIIRESPGYLLNAQKFDECEESIMFYHKVEQETARKIIKEMEFEIDRTCQSYGVFELWQDAAAKRGTLLGMIVMISMAMSGIAAINAFAFEILLSTGLTVRQSSYGNILICFMSVVGILCSSLVIEHFGRRRLLLSTYSLLAIINVAVFAFMAGYEKTNHSWLGYCLLVAISLFNFFFAAGPGPISHFVTAELVSQKARSAACTWAQGGMSLSRSLLMAGYLPLKNLIGQPLAYLLLFFPPMVISVTILYFYLPETKGKSVSEVQKSIEFLPKLRKTKVEEEQMTI